MQYTPEDHHRLLLDALANPDCLVDYSIADWELLLRLARKVKLLGRLATELNKKDLLNKIPVRAANLLRSGLIQAKRMQQLTYWELNRISWVLQSMDIPVITLKGVAYSLAGLPESDGRFYVDLDVMVPKEVLACVELELGQRGWACQKLSAYDEHYYRVWSHEIPPLTHVERETEVDIHHTITQPTSGIKINPDLFFEAAVSVEGTCYKILNPVDMVLHCAVNLFQNNELAGELRDLLDCHDLFVFFSEKDASFWEKLIERANQLNLGRPLFYALHFSVLMFKTPVPEKVKSNLNNKPSAIVLWVMNKLVPVALFPLHPDKPSKRDRVARTLLYLRGHWIRMPLYFLLPHFLYKSYLAVFSKKNNAL